MFIVNLKSIIEETENNGFAIGGFNITNLEMIEGVVEAAQNLDLPVIINIHPDHIAHTSLEVISSMVKEIAYRARIPIVLHIDYTTDLGMLREAISCGFTSLMFVAAAGLSFEDMIIETRNAVELAHRNGLLIESEFPPEKNNGCTDPEKAGRFVRETGIDILSPQIGTTHGGGKASLDLELLKKIKEKTGCYISLHGGSSVEDGIIQEAVRAGINKISVYSQTSKAALGKLKDRMGNEDIPDMAEASVIMKEAVTVAAIKRLKILSMKTEITPKDIKVPSNTGSIDNLGTLIKDIAARVIKKMDAG